MTILNALLTTAFLILVAASAAVSVSMIVLALFDRVFGRKKPIEEPPPPEEWGLGEDRTADRGIG